MLSCNSCCLPHANVSQSLIKSFGHSATCVSFVRLLNDLESFTRATSYYLEMATRQGVISWISTAVPEDFIRKSFKYCGISSELDGSEDELFNSVLTRALSVAAPSDSESDYESDDETDVYYNLD